MNPHIMCLQGSEAKTKPFEGEHTRSERYGSTGQTGVGQSDRDTGHEARRADRNFTRKCHQGQQDEHPAQTGRM